MGIHTKKLIILEDDIHFTNTLENLLKKNNIPYNFVNINDYVMNMSKWKDDILLVSDTMHEIIDQSLQYDDTDTKSQNVILLSDITPYKIKNDDASNILHVIDCINTNTSQHHLVKTLNQYLKSCDD